MNRTIRMTAALAAIAAIIALAGASVVSASTTDGKKRAAANPSALMPKLKPVRHLTFRTKTGSKPPATVAFHDTTVGSAGEVVLAVPAYKWRDGCAPTAVGMIVGYWDGQGYDDLVLGNAATATIDALQMISSHGTVDSPRSYEDYALPKETSATVLPDRSEVPVGDEHVPTH